jgi:hypothetical protein
MFNIKTKLEKNILQFDLDRIIKEIHFPLHKDNCHSQIINHFEFHNEVSNKRNLFINLLRYCENNNISHLEI